MLVNRGSLILFFSGIDWDYYDVPVINPVVSHIGNI
jgi:hypothetical protein